MDFVFQNEIEKINENFVSFSDVKKLLSSPIITHDGIDIKFKQTIQTIDKTSFLLKISIDNEKDKMDSLRIKLYITTLLRKNVTPQTDDRSTSNEQIILVHCHSDIGNLLVLK